MRIGILTHYNVNNQGAQLQLYALSRYLKSLGHETYVLIYAKNFDFLPEEAEKNNVSLSSIPYYLRNYLFDKGLGLTLHNAKKYQALKAFRSRRYQYLPYHTDDLDMIIIGSDEVYSIDVGINPMMYGHNLRCSCRVAYAPAFGRTTIDILRQEGCLNLVQSGLKDMTALSARDLHTQEMIYELTSRKAPLVCDPVFFMDFRKLKNAEVKVKKPYLLLYSYDANMTESSEIEAIQAYAKKKGLATVSAGTYHGWCDYNIACDPLTWIDYFKQADCVVTDTFHGYVTALKADKNTALYVRSALNGFKLISLMEVTETRDRQLSEVSEAELDRVLANPIDYELVDQHIDQIRKSGSDYLAYAMTLA